MEEATMEKERTLGVTEARFGLTILICGLVAIGYIVLLRLGSTNEAPSSDGPKSIQPTESRRNDAGRRPANRAPDRNPKPRNAPERSLLPGAADDKNSTDVQRR